MTERFYIERLKRMVSKHAEDLCNWCPMGARFNIQNDFIMPYGAGMGGKVDLSAEHECCVICEEITDRYADVSDCREKRSCPCISFEDHDLDPHKQALKIIEKWEKEKENEETRN